MYILVLYSVVSSERSTLVCHCRLSAKINKATPHTFYIYYPHSEQYAGTLCCAKDACRKNKRRIRRTSRERWDGWRVKRQQERQQKYWRRCHGAASTQIEYQMFIFFKNFWKISPTQRCEYQVCSKHLVDNKTLVLKIDFNFCLTLIIYL